MQDQQTTTNPGANTDVAKVPENPIKEFFANVNVVDKFREVLGSKAPAFVTSIMQLANNDDNLRGCPAKSIFNAAMIAATMDLPINKNLGFAWVIGYGGQAEFQMGYKGYVQLAMRTAQYLRINVIPVYENQFQSWNSLKEELIGDFELEGVGKVIGYAAYFKMINGFEKTVFWKTEKIQAHGQTYSKSFNNDKGRWKKDFDAMAKKTVLKELLSKWGYLSVEMQKAIVADQAIVHDDDEYTYPDNQETDEEKSAKKSNAAMQATLNMMDSKRKNKGK